MWHNICIKNSEGKIIMKIDIGCFSDIIKCLSTGVNTIYEDKFKERNQVKSKIKLSKEIGANVIIVEGKLILQDSDILSETEKHELENRIKTIEKTVQILKDKNIDANKMSNSYDIILSEYLRFAETETKRNIFANIIANQIDNKNVIVSKKCLRIISELDEKDMEAIDLLSKICFRDIDMKTGIISDNPGFVPVIFSNSIGIDANIHFKLFDMTNNQILYPLKIFKALEHRYVYCDGNIYFSHFEGFECFVLSKEGNAIFEAAGINHSSINLLNMNTQTCIEDYILGSTCEFNNKGTIRSVNRFSKVNITKSFGV